MLSKNKCSLDDNIKELIPIGGFEPTQTHAESFQVFYYSILYFIINFLFLLLL